MNSGNFWWIINLIFFFGPLIFMIIGIVRFIDDGVKAKRESRKRKISIKVMFVISLVLACWYSFILLIFLAFATGALSLM